MLFLNAKLICTPAKRERCFFSVFLYTVTWGFNLFYHSVLFQNQRTEGVDLKRNCRASDEGTTAEGTYFLWGGGGSLVVVLCCTFFFFFLNFGKCAADQWELKRGGCPDDSILTLIMTWPTKWNKSLIGPFPSWHVFSLGTPGAAVAAAASAAPVRKPLPVYNTIFLLEPSAQQLQPPELILVLSMTLMYMLGCLLLRGSQREKLQF